MSKWKQLDLSRVFDRPATGQLVALRMTPVSTNATYYKDDQYDIGQFQQHPSTGRKLWWHGTHGTKDPINLKKRYVIWWCLVQPFDL